jgi:hypothetical protein
MATLMLAPQTFDGLEALKDADLMVIFARFSTYPMTR